MSQPSTRLGLIEQRLPAAREGKWHFDARREGTRAALFVLVTGTLVCIVAFPFQGMGIGGVAGLSVLIGAATALFMAHMARASKGAFDARGRHVVYVLLGLVVLGAARLESYLGVGAEWRMLLAPAPLFSMVLAVVYGRRFAFDNLMLLFALLALMRVLNGSGLMLDPGEIASLGALMIGCMTAVALTYNLQRRTALLKVGLWSGIAMASAAMAFELLGLWGGALRDPWYEPLVWLGLEAAHGVVAGILATSLLPVLEYTFGIVTEIRLLELEDGNHPLLKMMLERAPGTFMHTQNVARIASAAVEAVGGNALLARAGTLFHDLGKMVRPEYFTENELNSKLYHDRLTPAMSAIIIISHVKEGVEIARKNKLPRIFEDFITGHHGTSLVKYFYHKAKAQAKEGERVEEGLFRYPGPKPRTREAAIVAIADLVEAAGRAKLDGPQTPGAIQKFVHDCIMDKLNDGQFDDCDLTLHDLKVTEDVMVRIMASMYHHRVKYPDDPDEKKLKLATLEKELYRKEMAKRKERILTQ